MFLKGEYQFVMINVVEKSFDIQIDHPVGLAAVLGVANRSRRTAYHTWVERQAQRAGLSATLVFEPVEIGMVASLAAGGQANQATHKATGDIGA